MKRIIFLFLFLLTTCWGFSQSDYQDGYIITNSDDTLIGQLDCQRKALNSSLCVFKKDSSSELEEFTPGEIKSYRFSDGKFYVSKQLPAISDGQNDPVFLECLFQGKANLFVYSSSIGLQFFIATDDSVLHELHNTKNSLVGNGSSYNAERREYIGELKYYLRDCPKIWPFIYETKFDRRSLIDLMQKYQNKTNENEACVVPQKDKNKLTAIYSANVSYLYSNIHMNNGDIDYLRPLKSVGYGLMIELSGIPDLSKKLSFRTGLNYYNNKYYIDTSLPYPYCLFPDPYIYHLRVFRLPMSFRYTFTNSFIRPYLEIGEAFNYRDVVKKLNLIHYWAICTGQFSSFADVGVTVSLKNNLKMDLGYCFERGFRFYAFADDKSYSNNHIFSFSVGYPF